MLHAVIMAGGSGTRFWPKSRRNRPKQLLRLFGDSTMLRQTVDRVGSLVPADRILVVTGADQADATRHELPDLPASNIIAEPCPRDTAACVGLAATILAARDPEAVMLMLPADHVVRPAETFQRTVEAAQALIKQDSSAFITLGVPPTRPETGYGYIEQGEPLGQRLGVQVHHVRQFREKPDLATAESFLKAGRFVWNSGVFLWTARAILDALATYKPGLAEALKEIADAAGTPWEQAVLEQVYPRLERAPIDKAVMEHYPNVLVIDVKYDWSDVGDWRSLAEFLPSDDAGNAIDGPVNLVDTRNSIIIADDGALVTLLGLDDVVVVQSGGATLVARKDKLDQLKGLVEGLGASGLGEYL